MTENADQRQPVDPVSSYTSKPGVITLISILTFIGVEWQVVQFAFFAADSIMLGEVAFLVTNIVLGICTGVTLVIAVCPGESA